MDSAGFDIARWDHWLLVFSFLAIASYGTYACWQWNRSAKKNAARKRRITRMQSHLAHQSAVASSSKQDARTKAASPSRIRVSYAAKRK